MRRTTVETKFCDTRTAGCGMVIAPSEGGNGGSSNGVAADVGAVAGAVAGAGLSRECSSALAALPTMSASNGLLKRSFTW